MFYVTYVLAELRRRSGRTVLTALGLAVGVGLVVTVTPSRPGSTAPRLPVLEPLTGLGTDMSVSRPPIDFSRHFRTASPNLSQEERDQLHAGERGWALRPPNLGEPGYKFSRDAFVSAAQLSFPASGSTDRGSRRVGAAAGGLTLNSVHIEGTVPEVTETPERAASRRRALARRDNIDVLEPKRRRCGRDSRELGAITPGQVTRAATSVGCRA